MTDGFLLKWKIKVYSKQKFLYFLSYVPIEWQFWEKWSIILQNNHCDAGVDTFNLIVRNWFGKRHLLSPSYFYFIFISRLKSELWKLWNFFPRERDVKSKLAGEFSSALCEACFVILFPIFKYYAENNHNLDCTSKTNWSQLKIDTKV